MFARSQITTQMALFLPAAVRGREDIPVLRRVWDMQCQIGPETREEASSEEENLG